MVVICNSPQKFTQKKLFLIFISKGLHNELILVFFIVTKVYIISFFSYFSSSYLYIFILILLIFSFLLSFQYEFGCRCEHSVFKPVLFFELSLPVQVKILLWRMVRYGITWSLCVPVFHVLPESPCYVIFVSQPVDVKVCQQFFLYSSVE